MFSIFKCFRCICGTHGVWITRGVSALGVSLGLQNNCYALNAPPVWLGAFSCEVLSRAALERAPGGILSLGLSHFPRFLESALAVVHGSALLIILGFPVNKYTYLKTSPKPCQITTGISMWCFGIGPSSSASVPSFLLEALTLHLGGSTGFLSADVPVLGRAILEPRLHPVKSILLMGG